MFLKKCSKLLKVTIKAGYVFVRYPGSDADTKIFNLSELPELAEPPENAEFTNDQGADN